MVLPTMANLTKWKMDGVTNKCPFCKKKEDLKHAFTECPRTKPLWDFANILIEKITGKTPPPASLDEVVFHSKTKTKDSDQEKLVRYIATTALTIIWNTRNVKLKDANLPELKEELKRRIKERINADITNNKMYNIKNIWSYENALIKVTGDKIIYTM